MKKTLLLLFFALSLTCCERDDICAEETTPGVVIEFFDLSNPTVPKNVSNLQVIGEGATEALTFSGTNKITLPLKITEDMSRYRLKIFSTSSVNANEDILQFNYSRRNVYVSRSCGYKTVFNLNEANGVEREDTETSDGIWLKIVTITENNITTENETHLKIYF